MTQQRFLDIKERIKIFKYSSMLHLDFSDTENYEVVMQIDSIVLLCGYNMIIKHFEYHWACDELEILLAAIGNSTNMLITFVPHEWIADFEKAGFSEYAAWNDYFMDNLVNLEFLPYAEFLSENECEEAAAVTLSCKGQSRGFTGQSADWFRLWLNGEEASAINTVTRNNAIIIHRNDSGEITGIVCTAIYAYESEKGPIVWIRLIAVKPEYQNKGIARKLIMQALLFGRAHGAKRAYLAADECNKHAIRLYEKTGFRASNDDSQIDMIRV